MPSSIRGGRGRSAIPDWRVKHGNHKGEVYSSNKKIDCVTFIRDNKSNYPEKLRLISPNY